MILQSRLLLEAGFNHGFSLRTGGVSRGPYASLNLGRAIGDDDAALDENRRRYFEALKVESVFELSQVHGVRVRRVSMADDHEVVRKEEGDGVWTDDRGIAVGVRVADCIPVLLAHPPTGSVAAVHSGWRGVEANIVAVALATMQLPPSECLAVIGPHIRAPRFEVGDDIANRLQAAADAVDAGEVVDRSRERPHVELSRIVRAQLTTTGLDTIDDLGGCTYDDSERFFSYRRDGKTGRHLAVIVAPTQLS